MRTNGVLRFDHSHRAIMWISTKGLGREHEELIVKEIQNRINRIGKEIIFIGHCFGRFDLIFEFVEESAKVASNLVCEIQNDLKNKVHEMITDELKKEIRTPLCSSLSINNKVLYLKVGKSNSPQDFPIRAYTHLRPRPKIEGVNLENLYTPIFSKLDSLMEIFWNSSSFSFLLTTNGNTFHDTIRRVVKFREETKDYFSESCTYVGLNYNKKYEEHKDSIKAKVFVKLREGWGNIKWKKGDEKIWTSEKRLGWSDLSLELIEPPKTLRELKEKILDLRESYPKEIENTSTLLLEEGYDL